MRRISSKLTWWLKKAFPVFWFGFTGLFIFVGGFEVILQQAPAFLLLPPFVLAAFGYVMMRWLVFPLADEVWIDGDDIVVRNNGYEDRFPITNIINVENSRFMNPERITLTLKEPCALGSEIVFSPLERLLKITRHPLAEELIRRAHGVEEMY
jgi:hypothetical protein